MTEEGAGNRTLFVLIAVLALAGIVVSSVSLQRHYAKSATTFCDISQKFSCDIVNRSEWSEVSGIPVAGIGVAGYALLFVLSTFRRSRAETATLQLALAIAGLGFAAYLTWIEAYSLMTWCVLCLISQAIIFLISVFALIIKLRGTRA